jgi:hypothetical protein
MPSDAATALARLRSICTSKFQIHPLVREGAQQQETPNCQTEDKDPIMGSRWEPDTETDWTTDRRS